MYLSKIELFGFKSFAHKVRIKFDKGLTAIVGPNGCGKTNVVDAMRWVLGEQKSSLLRSAKMENIIFNGSKNLKPLSFTEVSLTIENTRNVLPIEYTEVTVTRRLYRSGESEFLLNQVSCRLKDILDLFTDTGMGSDAYSVIELKMIEEIISNKSEERLKLFEEAAGITRYKQRRKQTFKLLESASRDLARVDDVLAEVGKKVRSLKLQVRKAEKLRELKQDIRDIDLTLTWLGMEELREKLEPMLHRIRNEELLSHEFAANIASEDSASQQMEVQLLDEETRLSELQKKLNESNQHIHALEKQLLQHEEHQKNLVTESLRTTSIISEKERKFGELELLESDLVKRKGPAEERCETLHDAFESLVAEHEQINSTLKEERSQLALKRKLSAEDQSAANQLALTKRTLESKKEHLRASGERLDNKKIGILEKLKASRTVEEQLSDEVKVKTAQLSEAKGRELLLREEQEKISGLIEGKKEALLVLKSKRDKVNNQILLADSVLDNFEGMPEGIGFLEKQRNGKQGFGCLSDLVSLDGVYKKAVNAALGESMSYYVCRSLEEAKEGIVSLRGSNKGKVNFLVLDLVAGIAEAEFLEIIGAERTLEVISYPQDLHDALVLMLGKSYIVPDLATAEALALKNRDCSFVTLEGETFAGRGLLYGGSSKSNEGLRLGKKAERNLLQKEIAGLEKSIREEDTALQGLRDGLGSLKVAEQRRVIELLAGELGALEKRSARFDAEENERKREIVRTDEEIAGILVQKERCEKELMALLPAMHSSALKSESSGEKIREMQEHLTSLETRHHMFSLEVQASQSKYKDALLDLEKLKINIAACAESRGALLLEITGLKSEIENAEKKKLVRRDAAELVRKELDARLIVAAKEQLEVNELESAYREHQALHHEALGALREVRRKYEGCLQQLATLNSERMQLEHALDHLFTEAQLKYNCDISTMAPPVIGDSFDRSEAQDKLALLFKQREQFGAVNELALEEYEGEKERFDFLTEQKEDLMSAETQLRTTIDEINKTALEKFEETFRVVRKNFIGIFRELFDAEDEVDLLIHESEDPLDAPIEIIAKPRGKKPLSIEQLSGGEKALTALSLLFAIYLVKPSPFCILDEVDAPLDDANVTRFIKLLKKFENNTQFIIVTHNKKTMASCQALYGVTMEEEGVSKLIPVRIEKIKG